MALIPIGRREVRVQGDGNCFYRAVARALNGKTDRNYSKVRSLCNAVIEDFPQVFLPLLFTHTTVEEHLKHSRKDGTWAETADIFSCATVLQHTIVVYSMAKEKWVKFDPYLKITARMTVKRFCDCPITLVLHDFFPQSSHFNLLETDGDCCSAPTPENSKESVFIDLVDPFAYMDELISSQVNKPTVLVSNPVEDKTSSAQTTTTVQNVLCQ